MGIIDAASEEADRRGGVTVVSIYVRLGALSGVVKESLESAFEMAREGSPMAESRLVIEEAPVAVLCPVCRVERPVRSIQCMCCSECGTPTAHIVRGRELEITALEIAQ